MSILQFKNRFTTGIILIFLLLWSDTKIFATTSTTSFYKKNNIFDDITQTIYFDLDEICIHTNIIENSDKFIEKFYTLKKNEEKTIIYYYPLEKHNINANIKHNNIFACYDDRIIRLSSTDYLIQNYVAQGYNQYEIEEFCQYISLYEAILSQKTTLHDEIIKLKQEYLEPKVGSYENFGTILSTDDGTQHFVSLSPAMNNSPKPMLALSSLINEQNYTGKMSMEKLFEKKEVREELKLTDLDLDNTNAAVIQNLGMLLQNKWGILLYDDNHEYLMPLCNCIYYPTFNGSQYMLPNEKQSINLEAYKIYNLKSELAPFLVKEYKLYIDITKRYAEDLNH